MGVYISGMKMPKRCIDCPFMVSYDNCVFQTEEANAHFTSWEDMKENCPLVEIKAPHGRLIDADALHYNRVQIASGGVCGGYNAVVMSVEIKDAPTIIEAEGKEDG